MKVCIVRYSRKAQDSTVSAYWLCLDVVDAVTTVALIKNIPYLLNCEWSGVSKMLFHEYSGV